MINHLLSLFIFCISCLYSIDCGVPRIDITSRDFPNILSKTKPGCKIVDHQNVIPLLRTHNCDSFLPPFPKDYFSQRTHLPCFGEYEAVISLCDFNTSDIIFKTPESFNVSKTFCQEAAKIYEQLNITYKEDDLNKWSAAVRETMRGNDTCTYLCIFHDQVNEKCVNMVWASSEYLRLSALEKNANFKAESKSNIEIIKTVDQSLIPEKQENQESLNPKAGQSDQSNVTIIPSEEKKEQEKFKKEQGEKPIDIDKIPEHPTKIEEKSPMPDLPTLPIHQPQKPNESPLQQSQETAGALTNSDTPEQASKQLPSVENPEGNKVDENIAIQGDEQNQLPSNDDEPGTLPDDEFSPNQENHVEGSTITAQVPEIFPIRKDGFVNTEDSYAFSYFATVVILCFVAYFLFHYKNKLLALALEGRKSRSSRGRGRPSSANYSKLHSNLEEAIASNVTTPSATHVLY